MNEDGISWILRKHNTRKPRLSHFTLSLSCTRACLVDLSSAKRRRGRECCTKRSPFITTEAVQRRWRCIAVPRSRRKQESDRRKHRHAPGVSSFSGANSSPSATHCPPAPAQIPTSQLSILWRVKAFSAIEIVHIALAAPTRALFVKDILRKFLVHVLDSVGVPSLLPHKIAEGLQLRLNMPICHEELKKGAWTPEVSTARPTQRRRRILGAEPSHDPQEDEQLKRLVAVHGPQKWSVVAEKIRGRSGKSCRLRWVSRAVSHGLGLHPSRKHSRTCRWWNHLNPAVKKGTFSEWEDAVIIKVGGRVSFCHMSYTSKSNASSQPIPGRGALGLLYVYVRTL
jgi:hypothetical protein